MINSFLHSPFLFFLEKAFVLRPFQVFLTVFLNLVDTDEFQVVVEGNKITRIALGHLVFFYILQNFHDSGDFCKKAAHGSLRL